MKKILVLLAFIGVLSANDENAKLVIDLTTDKVKAFELKVLSGTVANKTHYANSLRELDVAVVIHGGAYRFFVKDLQNTIYQDDKELVKAQVELQKRIATLADTYDVEFLMCGSGMKKNKLDVKNIMSSVKIVPTSTIGLIDKQNEGFAYIPVND